MGIIHLRLTNGIVPPLPVVETERGFELQQPSEYAGFSIDLRISPRGDTIASMASVEIDAALAKTLSEAIPQDLSTDVRSELRKLFAVLSAANGRSLRLIAQELEHDELRILNVNRSSYQWSLNGETWEIFPLQLGVPAVSLRPRYELDSEWRDHLQSILSLGEEPFIAFEHFHAARRTRETRSAWIEATTAAELAIKEALVRLEPRLATLLFEVPAPPLSKLYGVVLEGIAGERSPYANKLQSGAERRNRLVHKPKAEKLDMHEVWDYVDLVDHAIWHLIELCRRGAKPKLHRAAQLRS